MRGFSDIRKPVSGTCQAFSQSSLDYILNHPELTNCKVKLSETPYILIRTRLYNERRKEHEQKQKSAGALVC